ncbi:MAG: cysteine hydrolase [Clostridium argentinense]|uniref:Cysteine hydrolase n=1 Tax=Clostridium faecium TaxID=2762223 RepID=A0ABR8YWL4_9CLOT|nr:MULTISPECIES: isochorismatase family cysteine hydrolase [Clostridium]MBD8048681.1 cysteine hydrolase [Clostridium faecium]MBS5824491.1 cysteine hydrolase [Clostridium argentinense]
MFNNINDYVNSLESIISLIKEKSKNSISIKELSKRETALVVIDMINGFAKSGNLYSPRVSALIPEIYSIMKYCSDENIEIIAFGDSHTNLSPEFNSYPEHCIKGTFEADMVEPLKSIKNYNFIEKNSTNGFLEEKFQNFLKDNPKITNFIIVGDCTDICIEQFASTLKAHFNKNNIASRIIVPINAVDTYDLPPHHGDLMHLLGLFMMINNGIEIINSIK